MPSRNSSRLLPFPSPLTCREAQKKREKGKRLWSVLVNFSPCAGVNRPAAGQSLEGGKKGEGRGAGPGGNRFSKHPPPSPITRRPGTEEDGEGRKGGRGLRGPLSFLSNGDHWRFESGAERLGKRKGGEEGEGSARGDTSSPSLVWARGGGRGNTGTEKRGKKKRGPASSELRHFSVVSGLRNSSRAATDVKKKKGKRGEKKSRVIAPLPFVLAGPRPGTGAGGRRGGKRRVRPSRNPFSLSEGRCSGKKKKGGKNRPGPVCCSRPLTRDNKEGKKKRRKVRAR